MRVPSAAARFKALAQKESHADREYRHVLRVLDLLHDLVEREFAERVDSRRYQDDVLLAFHAVKPIQCVVEGIEQISLRKSRNA